ncbi:MAG: electron transfer flavoprotein subunit beta [Pseudomonadota bacterium]
MTDQVIVLVSLGRHPVSARARRALLDARAVTLARSLRDVSIDLIHAGSDAEPALRDYLGMGVARMSVLTIASGDDIVPPLLAYLETRPGALVLAGERAEQGEASGMVPYLLAERSGRPLVPGAAGLSFGGERVEIAQGLAGGRRRKVGAPRNAIVTVSSAAPDPAPVAFAQARRGTIETVPCESTPYAIDGHWQAARPKPRRLKIVGDGSAADRMRAATQMVQGRAELLDHPEADEAARAILDYLTREGVVRPDEEQKKSAPPAVPD